MKYFAEYSEFYLCMYVCGGSSLMQMQSEECPENSTTSETMERLGDCLSGYQSKFSVGVLPQTIL